MTRIPGAFKKVQGMGAPLEVFPLKNAFLLRAGGVGLSILCILGGIAAAGMAGLDAYNRYYRHGPAVIWRGLALPLILALLLIVVGIFIASGLVSRWKKTLVLFEQGVAVRDREGLVACRWAEAASLRIAFSRRTFAGIGLSTTRNVILVREDGERVCFDGDLRGADDALEKIRARLLPIFYERFEPEFEAGHAFVFGPIELQKKQGIRLKQKTMDWQALQKADIDQGRLQIATSDSSGKAREISVPVADIPNLDLLMAFIRQIKPAV
jgi:hypothetical protein